MIRALSFFLMLVLGGVALLVQSMLFAQVAPPVVATVAGPIDGLFNGAYVQVAPAPKVLRGSYILACAPDAAGVMKLIVWYGDPEVYAYYFIDAQGNAVPIVYSIGNGHTAKCAAWISISPVVVKPYGAHDCCPSLQEMQTHLVQLATSRGYTNVALPVAN